MTVSSSNKILVIRFSSLGDVILTTPVIRSIKKINPGAEIDFLVKSEFSDAIRYNPNISELFEFRGEAGLNSLIATLSERHYDLVIDLQNNFRSRTICRRLGIKNFKYIKPSIKKLLLVKTGINLYKNHYSIPELYIKNIPELELDENNCEVEFPHNAGTSLLEDKKYIGFCPGAKHFTKRWPEEYFFSLGKKIVKENFGLVLFGGRDDKEICERIINEVPEAINLAGDNNLFALAADMKKCRIIICNDTGLMHLATSVKVPVICLFGSSVKEFGFSPYKSPSLILENNSLTCRPCSHVGRNKCPQKHFDCMNKITPDLVWEEFKKFYKTI